MRRYSIDAISVGCSKSCIIFASILRLAASISKLTCTVFFIFFLADHSRPANQLFLVFGDAVSVNFPADKKPFCRGRLQHVDEDATLLSVLRVVLGDNESFATLRFRDLTKQEKIGTMSFFTSSSKTIKRSSSRRSLETANSNSLHLRGQPSNTHVHAAWATLATTFFWQRGYRYQSYCSLLL